jgi:hypothetical protein
MRVIADNVPHGGTIHGIRPGGSRVLLPAVSHDHAKKSQGLLDLGPAHNWRTPARRVHREARPQNELFLAITRTSPTDES